jgi:RimJ/RimL family protein N-acetyltransferase
MTFVPERYSALLSDGSPVVLRAPESGELDELVPIDRDVRIYDAEGSAEFLHDRDGGRLATRLGAIRFRSWLIEAYEQPVGYVAAAQYGEPYPSADVYITKYEFLGKGIGSRARAIAALDTFRTSEYPAVGGRAHVDNKRALAMLGNLGFQRIDWQVFPDRGGYREFLLPRPGTGPGPIQLTEQQVQDGRRIFEERLASFTITKL